MWEGVCTILLCVACGGVPELNVCDVQNEENKENVPSTKRTRIPSTPKRKEILRESFFNEQRITPKAARKFPRDHADTFEEGKEKKI